MNAEGTAVGRPRTGRAAGTGTVSEAVSMAMTACYPHCTMSKWSRGMQLLALSVCAACGGQGDEGSEPTPVELRPALAVDHADVVGVTVSSTGERYVLDATTGLYRLDGGVAERLAASEMLAAASDVQVTSPFTDLALMNDGRFLLTARDDGFIYDPATGRVTQHFCYLPPPDPGGGEPDPGGEVPDPTVFAASQMTHSLAYAPQFGRILAQPQSYDSTAQDAPPVAAHVALFSVETGEDLEWLQLPDASFRAGGLALDPDDRLLLGSGSTVYAFVEPMAPLEPVLEIDGIDIQGMTVDATTGSLLIVDGIADQLIAIDLPE